jgi:hypothetical protein
VVKFPESNKMEIENKDIKKETKRYKNHGSSLSRLSLEDIKSYLQKQSEELKLSEIERFIKFP